ncbi:MaoC family dehydratase N-terminal domain-containing protein [Shimia sp. R11_0]|uniref:FAS1-like dehydratase domain-containing protein n=1 Tax=Shimia sp. R11_0 TaxID=2821096 RepID=UPI001ADB89B0|nr:MaoC family dehydratase N-terminal domain-containing protein [Shimia sp. R11_0]MBO9478842.1 MaoC family dehydratase N-terminal domain-containing protein [Shimia sp. R11_0]
MGIFDRSTKGQITPSIRITVEPGPLAFFTETIGETNPLYRDRDAARAAGHPDVLAPPTYAVVVGTFAEQKAKRAGAPDLLDRINGDLRVLLHGTEEYAYHGLMYATDTLEVENEVMDFTDAKGGKLEIAHIATRISHPKRGLLVEASRRLIHRLG